MLPMAIPALAAGVAGVALVAAVLALPAEPRGLSAHVEERLEESGVTHPVTAVLLNFRAYDTWLEVAVLFAAAAATLAVRNDDGPRAQRAPVSPVVRGLAQRLVPVMGLVAIYLLATGTHDPGGAFQAAAVLAAASILLAAAGYRSPGELRGTALRGALSAGTAAFLAIAIIGPLAGAQLLELPPALAHGLIVAVEVVLTASIAVTLAFLFLAATPPPRPHAPGDAEPDA
jgi:multisubunit Na+/H+ antiporter MnhB subunit